MWSFPLRGIAMVAAAFFMASAAQPAAAQTATGSQILERAQDTLARFLADPDFAALPDDLARARGVLIIPDMIRGGFIVGVQTGNGVLLQHLPDGRWSQPVIYNVGGASVGLQAGGQESETVLAIMTQDGVNAVMNNTPSIGVGADVAVASAGAGVEAATGANLSADMVAFSKNKGLFAGASLKGTAFDEDTAANTQLYGPGYSAQAILSDQMAGNVGATLSAMLP